MSSAERSPIDLGFAEECNAALLRNVYFPSKIGGKPAWLDLDAIPSKEELACKKCASPMSFLCQIYAPIESQPECFHRIIYLFICREVGCFVQNSAENIAAFRSQLPRQNKFYSAVPPNEDDELEPIEPPCKICVVCGCRGPSMCSRCKSANYCSAKHQRAHWPQHKVACKSGTGAAGGLVPIPSVVFPEFEIVIELETPARADDEHSDDETAEKRRLEEYQQLVDQGKAGTLSDLPESELKKYAGVDEDNCDVVFRAFKAQTAANPSQVLRYDLGGTPLWIADVEKTIGQFQVPPCGTCKEERRFEFQIMPQMLNFLKDENVDWGVLAVYTCKNSCEGAGYAREFVVKQDIVAEDSK